MIIKINECHLHYPIISSFCSDNKMENSTLVDSYNTTNTKPKPQLEVAVIMFLFGAIGNLIAITFLCMSKKRHLWRPFYRLVGSLALTDLSGTICVFPVVMHSSASGYTFVFPSGLCEYMSFMWAFSFLASAMLVCCMSLDRFMAILLPFHYNTTKKNQRVNIMIITVWIASAIVTSLHIFGLGSAKKFFPGSWCFINFTSSDQLNRINTFIYSSVGLAVLVIRQSF